MIKGLRRHFFLTMLCCLVVVWAISDARGTPEPGPQMSAALVPNQTSVGGIIDLILKFQLPKGAKLDKAPAVTGLEGFQVLDQRRMHKSASKKDEKQNRTDETIFEEYRIRLMVYRLDSGMVGPVSLEYVNADGKKASIQAAPVSLTVLSNLGDKPEAARLKSIYGIIPTQSFLWKYRFWILGGIVVLLLGAALELWLRNRRQKLSAVKEETPPDKLAIRGLKELDAQKLFEKGRIKDFYFRFSEIMRHYLEALRGFPAAEYTLEEIARAIQKKEDQPLLPLLRRADMVKFADLTVTPAAKAQDMEAAFKYIHRTREPVMPQASANRRGGRQYPVRKSRAAQKRGRPS